VKRTRTLVLTKRDGTLERFNFQKLRVCLSKALQAAGDDRHLAEPLARAIADHLERLDPSEMPSTEYVFRCACAVLEQTGLAEAARLLVAHRRLREARRQRVQVYDPAEPGRPPCRWRKDALVSTLQNAYDLRQAVARFLAGRIEERVFELGYRLLSKGFIAELVRNEVSAWGLLVDRVVENPPEGTDSPPARGHPAKEE